MLTAIENRKLLSKVTEVGKYLMKGLKNIEENTKGLICNTRGKGTLIAFDTKMKPGVDLHKILRQNGINTGNAVNN